MPLSYRPRERRTLENLISALGAGLSPDVGYGIFSDVQGSAEDRLAFQREKMLQRKALRQQVMPEMANFISQTAASGLPQSVAQTAYSGYGPHVQSRLDNLVNDVYMGQQVSPYAALGGGSVDPDAVRAEIDTIDATVPVNIQQNETFDALYGLFSSRWQAMGFDPTTIDSLSTYLRQTWESAGGQIGSAPVAPPSPASPGVLPGAALGATLGIPFGPPGIALGSALGGIGGKNVEQAISGPGGFASSLAGMAVQPGGPLYELLRRR